MPDKFGMPKTAREIMEIEKLRRQGRGQVEADEQVRTIGRMVAELLDQASRDGEPLISEVERAAYEPRVGGAEYRIRVRPRSGFPYEVIVRTTTP